MPYMHTKILRFLIVTGFLLLSNTYANAINVGKNMIIPLPKPVINKAFSLDRAIEQRRSVRDFSNIALTQEQTSQLLWAAQGITDKNKKLRTAPSAGALYPLQLYIVTNTGISAYLPHEHSLKNLIANDLRTTLANYCLNQSAVKQATLDIVIIADYSILSKKYGDRAVRYAHLEAGHVAQNILLEATAMGIAAVPIGAFEDTAVQKLLNLPSNQTPLYVIPIGNP